MPDEDSPIEANARRREDLRDVRRRMPALPSILRRWPANLEERKPHKSDQLVRGVKAWLRRLLLFLELANSGAAARAAAREMTVAELEVLCL